MMQLLGKEGEKLKIFSKTSTPFSRFPHRRSRTDWVTYPPISINLIDNWKAPMDFQWVVIVFLASIILSLDKEAPSVVFSAYVFNLDSDLHRWISKKKLPVIFAYCWPCTVPNRLRLIQLFRAYGNDSPLIRFTAWKLNFQNNQNIRTRSRCCSSLR